MNDITSLFSTNAIYVEEFISNLTLNVLGPN